MIRMAVSVEGTTEEKFVNAVLKPYLHKKSIYITPIILGKAGRHQKQGGGNVSIDRIKRELSNLVYNFDYVTTFYDFYGFQKKDNQNKQQLEQRILNTVDSAVRYKVIPYIQMHELKACYFLAPNQ